MKLIRNLALATICLVIFGCGQSNPDNEKRKDEKTKENSGQQETVKKEKAEKKEPASYFSHKDGKFKVRFPGEPKETNDIIPTEVGDIEITMFLYEQSVTKAFMVSYNDYPSAIVEQSDPQKLLEGGVDGFTSNSGLNTIDVQDNIKVEGYPGIYFEAKGANNLHAVCKVFIADNRLYQVAIMRDGSYPSKETIDSFIGSFELLKEEDAAGEEEKEMQDTSNSVS